MKNQPAKKSNGKSRRRVRFLLILLILGLLLGGGVAWFLGKSPVEMVFTAIGRPDFRERANILLVGVDNLGDPRRADSIMVLHVNPREETMGLLSIPRDSQAAIPGYSLDKINHAFAYGGLPLLKQSVEQLLGISIPYYAVVNFQGLIKMVDRLGGVTVTVDAPMVYQDRAGKLNINLQPGVHHLSGYEAMGYVRFRYDAGGDFSRMKRQQRFLQAVGDELDRLGGLVKLPFIVRDLIPHVETNLQFSQIVGLARRAKEAHDEARVQTATLVGNGTHIGGIYYLVPDPMEKRALVQRLLEDEVAATPIGSFSVQLLPRKLREAKLALLANNHPWLVEQAAAELKAHDGEVVATPIVRDLANQPSAILVQHGGVDRGKQLARVLGIPEDRVVDAKVWIKTNSLTTPVLSALAPAHLIVWMGSDWGRLPQAVAE